ncbi:type I restriction enzyme HsdR N-terminal domain-containing protein [Pectobacterium polaris]|uniref:type I restriction enzyme HsdR N-terminal domain-containing protein n=1 Tax=Pectobacterium polaris TaxID=2042057 RepID=UPI0020BECBCA|nr:type I restriction enzyme HsdR N-terminal domain-containing protein [Pectobacterium polaris]
MPMKRTTTEETEADLEARIHAAINTAFPSLPNGTIKHQIKFSFKFGRQTLVVDNGKSRAEARLDILLEHNDIPLAVMELKRPGSGLDNKDGAQGLSYARLLQPPAPLVVITDGTEVTLLETGTGNIWHPETFTEETFQKLITQASCAAKADIRHAIDTLMGTSPTIWMQAVRQISAETFNELMASQDEPALPFTDNFLIPRNATRQLWQHLLAEKRLLVLEGAPLSGKSNVLRELCQRTKSSNTIAALYLEAGTGRGALQVLADAISRSLGWPVSPQEARDWLIRVSHHEHTRLVLAFDGVQATDETTIREIEDFSSAIFGSSLSVIVAMDEPAAQSILTSPNQRSRSPLGRRAEKVHVGHLDDSEFNFAQTILSDHRVYLMKGADMAPEYREPWVLRAIWSSTQTMLKDKSVNQALSFPSLLGLQLLELVREQFSDSVELRRRFRCLARSMISDTQDSTRPYELALQQIEMGIIRRTATNTELESGDLEWLIAHGYVRPGMDKIVGPTILVRLPELLASEMAYALADDLTKRLNAGLDETAVWISEAASNLPLGEVVAAQAIIDAAKRSAGLPIGLINALLKIQPEREILDAGSRYAMMLPDDVMVDVKVQPNGKGIIVMDGQQHEIDLDDESLITYKNIYPWLILSHVASIPFETQDEQSASRKDPYLLFQIGTSPVPLRGNRGPQSLRMIPTSDLPGEVSVVHRDAGIIEPVTLGILNYLSNAGDQADSWITAATHVSSVALFSRIHTALWILAEFDTHERSDWAKNQLKTIIYPKMGEAISDAEKNSSLT